MTPGEIAEIRVSLTELVTEMREVRADVTEIKGHTSQTNGKVAVLMADKIARDAVAADRARGRAWVSPLMVGLAAAGLGSFLTALFTVVL